MFYRLFSPYGSRLVNVRKDYFCWIFVLGRGIEPPRDCSHTPLKRTRLPVSPPEHTYVCLLYHLVFYYMVWFLKKEILLLRISQVCIYGKILFYFAPSIRCFYICFILFLLFVLFLLVVFVPALFLALVLVFLVQFFSFLVLPF